MDKLSASKGGLSSSEANDRLQKYGPNEIPEKKVNPIVKFVGYFWGPIPWMIEAAVIMSAVISRWEDFGIIFALLLLNAVVGFWQEHKADNAIELLKQKLALRAWILRDGKWLQVPARELVLARVTQLIATLITVYGFLLPAMGWGLVLLVWGYAPALFVITDFKVRLYKLLNHTGIRFHR